ncbi:MAG TPA: hypothetical protein VD789_12515 [Thermomicrobiales bacterium]|nr:hypothetical protein [Thermomicrobiales bacterium]
MSTRTVSRISSTLLILGLVVTLLSTRPAVAAPGSTGTGVYAAAQNVDWLNADQAARLALDFPVLVPSWIPGPFGGSPSIQAGGGYYSLYWMIPGGEPTFLQITGEVGGSLPAGSPADLNQQLFINASVQGYDAIHDVTSIYDNVWWIAGGVLYTVSSRNMTGTDSISLANSLITLEPPVVEEPEPTLPPVESEPTLPPEVAEPTVPPDEVEQGPTGSISNASSVESGGSVSLEVYPSGTGTLRATDGAFVSSGGTSITGLTGGAVSWQAPAVSSESVVEFTLLDADTGTVTATSSIVVYPTATDGGSEGDTNTDGGSEADTSTDDGTGGDTSVEPGDPDTSEDTGTVATETATAEATEVTTEDDSDLVDEVVAQAAGDTDSDTSAGETPVAVQTPVIGGTNGAPVSDGTAGAQIPQIGDGTAGPSVPRGGDGTGGLRQIVVP